MISTGAIIAIGVVLLALIALVRARSAEKERPASPGAGSQEFVVRLPQTNLLARCISLEDVAYVSGLRAPSLSHLLFRERRRLALLWLRQTRREAGRLYRLHLRTSGQAVDLQPVAELQLLFHFASFLIVYQILISVVWLYGPVRARAFVRSVRALADILASHVDRIAGAITSSQASAIRVGRGA